MTAPPPDDHQDLPDAADAPIDDAQLAALRALLRDEPVTTDPAATETRILAALDAADTEPLRPVADPAAATGPSGPRTTSVAPARRTWSARPVLVAAALLAVVGIGAVVWGSTDRDAEFMASAGDAATDAQPTGDGDGDAGGAELGEVADDSTLDDRDGGSAAQGAGAPTSTAAPAAPSEAAAGTLDDLGDFDSVEQLLQADPAELLERLPGDLGSDTARSTQFDRQASAADACAVQRSSSGELVLGVATVTGTPVLVVQADGNRAVLELPACRPLR
jgi:hypothetical protein